MRLPDLAAAWADGRLALVAVDASKLVRLTRFPGSEPHWGKAARYRFDDPAGYFGVTYAAFALEVAFAETLLHEQGCFMGQRWIIEQARIEERYLVRYAASERKPLHLADFTGAALKRLGLNNDLCAWDDYAASMQLAAVLHAQVPVADGILYVSRQVNTERAVALFERSGVRCEPAALPLSAHPDYAALLDAFGVELLPRTAPPPP